MKDHSMPAQDNETGRTPLTYDLISKYRGALMGLTILGIMVFHFTEDCHNYDMKFHGLIAYYYTFIGSSGVDTFLVLSGFGLFYSMKRKPNIPLGRFYWRRYAKILIPYILVAVPSMLWQDILVNHESMLYFLKELSFVTLFQQGRTWYWYILMIGLCYLIFPYLFQLVDQAADDMTAQMRVMTLFSFVTIICVAIQLYAQTLFNHTNILLLRFPPFIIGCYLGRVAWRKKKICPGVLALCGFSVFLLPLRMNNNVFFNRYLMAFFNLTLCLLFVILLEYAPVGRAKQVIIKGLDWFGTYSLELYLTHVMIRGILNTLGYHTSRFRYEAL
ncbi:MAG: acyltransferase, partial [Oscillospiraceae bacterium]|nr:acyltransferase [Oscillospiraceae bacterium]